MTERRATHKCTICDAQWQDLGEFWTLVSKDCGTCCDNAPMGSQIVPLVGVMTDAECAETLSEFRKLTLGPELSAALDHAIGRLRPAPMGFALGPLADSRALDLAAA